ncbi:hypothetical protein U1Q18_011786 [Sarracenia purpurea var. burkii]
MWRGMRRALRLVHHAHLDANRKYIGSETGTEIAVDWIPILSGPNGVHFKERPQGRIGVAAFVEANGGHEEWVVEMFLGLKKQYNSKECRILHSSFYVET